MRILPGDPPVTLTLRRSARARRLSLRVSRLDGRVTLTLPVRAAEGPALAFAAERAGWIRDALAEMPMMQVVRPDCLIPVEGRALRLVAAGSRGAPRIEGDRLVVPGDPARAAVRAQAFLKALARDRLAEASDRHAAALGRRYHRLTLRDTRSRWGSCTADGNLMYSWRLILAPPEVLDYVAAHEVAHLARMDHSPAFWATVARLMPGYEAPRRWLKRQGQDLHGYRFAQ
ncbi:M48 family metallopeptidase [Acidimangrovimonas sediminis]|uniref:M48 family metallopeptidase n=1 Tax=Acidimangrovimonas sediminis TaxID=2056283 RepID=UPI0018EB5822|nr:SprT family zinc-dependent metalloprotease [Acidimangrovimonas sediminis]